MSLGKILKGALKEIRQKAILPLAVLATTIFGATAFNPNGYPGVVGFYQNNNPINSVGVTSNLVLNNQTTGEWEIKGNLTRDMMREDKDVLGDWWGLQYALNGEVGGKIANETYENNVALKLEGAMLSSIAAIRVNGGYNFYGKRWTSSAIIELGVPAAPIAIICRGGIGATNRVPEGAGLIPLFGGTIAYMPEDGVLKELSLDFEKGLDYQEAKPTYNTTARATFGFEGNDISIAMGSKTEGWQRFCAELELRRILESALADPSDFTGRTPLRNEYGNVVYEQGGTVGAKIFFYGPSENEEPHQVRAGLGVTVSGLDEVIKNLISQN